MSDNEALESLLARFSIKSDNLSLYQQAFTHASYSNEHADSPDYDRLEFLGDDVVDLIITESLSKAFPEASSGKLSKMRSALVNGDILSHFTEDILHSDVLVRYSVGEKDNVRFHKHIHEDVFESFIGAVYLDQGFLKAREIVLYVYGDMIKNAWQYAEHLDSKGRLQELMLTNINYVVVSQKNINTPDCHFIVHAKINDQILGIGEGHTIKEAELNAAEDALKKRVN